MDMGSQSSRNRRLALLAAVAALAVTACAVPNAATGGGTTTTRPHSTTTSAPRSTTTTTTKPHGSSTTTTVAKATTTTTTAPRATTTTLSPTSGQPGGGTVSHFSTLPPGSALPSDATCAAEVRSAAETRSKNNTANHTKGTQKNLTTPYPLFSRVDGNFTGTTDEIIQWAACKWGIDEDIVRAQSAAESWWDQSSIGDFASDSTACVPGHGIGVDGHPGQCPDSGGLLSLTYRYYQNGFPEAMTSTAYNVDYVLAWWRACYEGQITWLNTVDRGSQYAAGDAWGCVGTWYAGRWHTAAAEGYITTVKNYLAEKVWTTPSFLAIK
jgi:autotransporter family porin